MSGAIERFYSFDDIAKIDALQFAIDKLGLQPIDGKNHFNCPWRPGSNSGAFVIGGGGWTDFTKVESDPERDGGLITLVARYKFNDNMQEAQQFIGDAMGLEVMFKPQKLRKTRASVLQDRGYEITARYDYQDENGEVVHQVLRYEHKTKPELKKEFVQRTPGGWGMSGVKTYLYQLPKWITEPTVYICEGEKDADNLAKYGYPATTNPAGAGRWEDHYNDWLKGKDIVIVEDNDQSGRDRTAWLLFRLKDVARSLRVIRFSMLPEHGDASDWISLQIGNWDFSSVISDVINPKTIRKPNEDYEAIQRAKEANRAEFSNYTVVETKNDDGKPSRQRVPVHINNLVDETQTRFLGFPKRIGEQLFDHDRVTGEIETLDRQSDLFAWIQSKSKRHCAWGKGERYVTKDEFFALMYRKAERYHTVSHVPDWPIASGVYYAHGDIPEPDPDHKYFEQFCALFNNMASHSDKILFKAFVASALYYQPGVPKPFWVIDSEDGQGSGKSKLVEWVAHLFGSDKHPGAPISVSLYQMNNKYEEITKRLLSDEGRHKRIFLIDNATGILKSSNFSSLITSGHITGRRSYGRGEEIRPNNLSYVATANSATVDSDLAHRAFYLMLTKPNQTKSFNKDVRNYINQNRMNIVADMIDILKNNPGYPDIMPVTRFPEFEADVVQKFCPTIDDYEMILSALEHKKSETNIDEEHAKCIEETFNHKLIDLMLGNEKAVFIRAEIARQWVADALPHLCRGEKGQDAMGLVSQLARSGMLRRVMPKIRRYPSSKSLRRSGIMWGEFETKSGQVAKIVGKTKDGKAGIVIPTGSEPADNGECPI